jgi:tetratricopeptide (TPR) repeat protein
MKAKRIGLAAAAVAALVGVAPVAGVQDGEIAALVVTSPPTRSEKAAQLKLQAEALFSQPSQWKKAVRLLEQSAALRDANDAEGYECLLYAGRIRAAIGDMDGARAALEKAAEHALARGAIVDAAHAYIDAAHTAVALKDARGAKALVGKAALLSDSPLLSLDQRTFLKARISA